MRESGLSFLLFLLFLIKYLYLINIVSYTNLHVNVTAGDSLKVLGSHTVKMVLDKSFFTH